MIRFTVRNGCIKENEDRVLEPLLYPVLLLLDGPVELSALDEVAVEVVPSAVNGKSLKLVVPFVVVTPPCEWFPPPDAWTV
jgi:hypothetical protein